MILTVDVGNSNIVLGVYDDSRTITAHWRLSTLPLRTADELRVVLAGLLRDSDLEAAQVRAIVVGCVVPPVLSPLVRAMKALFDADVHIVTADSVPWLKIAIDNRKEIGADLIANAVSSQDYVQGTACAVFDFGTALSGNCLRGIRFRHGAFRYRRRRRRTDSWCKHSARSHESVARPE